MSVMHLRLEELDDMDVPASRAASDKGSNLSREGSVDEHGGDGSFESRSPGGFHRIPSMNMATDPSAWLGATLPSAAGGGTNPFDFSSDDDDDDDDDLPIDQDGGEDGPSPLSAEEPARQPSKLNKNPFDFSFYGDPVGEGKYQNRDGSVAESARGAGEAATNVLPTSQTARICQLFPPVEPSPPALDATVEKSAWPAIKPLSPFGLDQLHPFVLSQTPGFTSANEWDLALMGSGSAGVPGDYGVVDLPPPSPMDKSMPASFLDPFCSDDSPVTPPATPAPEASPDPFHALWDGGDMSINAAPATAIPCVPESKPKASMEKVELRPKEEEFNPFARPGSFVMAPAEDQPAPTTAGKVRKLSGNRASTLGSQAVGCLVSVFAEVAIVTFKHVVGVLNRWMLQGAFNPCCSRVLGVREACRTVDIDRATYMVLHAV